jgi:NAD+ kinase
MKVAVFGTSVSEEFIAVINGFFSFLKKSKAEVQLFKPFYFFLVEKLGVSPYYSSLFDSNSDFDENNKYIFSVGGDGTFLHALLNIQNFEIPVIGVNSGRLGFLADISQEQMCDALENIFNRNYSVVERSMLQIEFEGQKNVEFNFALNEMTVSKTATSSMVNVLAYLDKELLANYWADGLIIATPTGSTAYSLSVGGPILTPDSENFVITPLAPHNLTVRPLVVPDKHTITLKVEGRGTHYLASFDFRSIPVDFSTKITVKKAGFKLKTLQLSGQTFFSTLRNKLMWGVDKRN